MPLIRCQKCGQAYDVPGVVAVRLPNSIATCVCGEWLSGSKAALLARLMNPDQIKEVDLKPFLVNHNVDLPPFSVDPSTPPVELPPGAPRSIRIDARGANESLHTIFTIHEHPLWIGRKGCHVELSEAELSIRHCSISLRGNELVVRDDESHTGTFLDGEQITEAVISDGVHLLRVGTAIVSVEPTSEPGQPVQPIKLDSASVIDESALAKKLRERTAKTPAPGTRVVLVCIDGVLKGQEFEIPPTGLVVGREGHVRVPDEFLSRKHFEVVPDAEGAIRVRDLGSRNGTFLNTLPAQNAKVAAGDEIRAGVNRFRIEPRS
jgi:pSer/pThr/pTyr-binding forkhead associated (FHA) protein